MPQAQKIKPAMYAHVRALGGWGVYENFCRDNKLAYRFDKSRQEMETERQLHEQLISARLRKPTPRDNAQHMLAEILAGRIRRDQVISQPWLELADMLQSPDFRRLERTGLAEFFAHIGKCSDLLTEQIHVDGVAHWGYAALLRIYSCKSYWVRDLKDWKPKSHNVGRQFRSLLQHLFAKFDVAVFLERAWFDGSEDGKKFRRWYMHVGCGENIRTAQTPVTLTKMMAHHMMRAPDNLGILQAIRWGQVLALGGNKRLAEEVVASRIGSTFANDDFWQSVIRFFVVEIMFDRRQVGPVIDYLHEQKFEQRQVLDDNRRVITLPPAQPGLTMRGRTADSLMTQVNGWHRQLARSKNIASAEFPTSGLKTLRLEVGHEAVTVWRIRELASTEELRLEGQKMQHCVLSYARSCVSGHDSIWAMEVHLPDGTVEKRQTIQVRKGGHIVQCRGKQNRLPTAQEFDMLQRWATYAGLVIARGVTVG